MFKRVLIAMVIAAGGLMIGCEEKKAPPATPPAKAPTSRPTVTTPGRAAPTTVPATRP